ncbi:LacI family transcriptional regulator [Arthrobacter sp. 9AX]|uniref:LacI family DNA-binding transcriptional regulator n=1 Tax=Arthrobacter sp. 9AX TaxID=2653131 RepID=UPI0012F2CDAF|nr:LacI family DNA-binding transcriptional regulator [Arthrobacter sp. 9AX]VXB06357.1 LacI family transcriptional regulator [Arthrobacter sp. 9AX]
MPTPSDGWQTDAPVRENGGGVRIKDVAKHAGVSVTTVSNVLNDWGRTSEATRKRVMESIEHLGYVRNAAAWQLRAGYSTTIGLIVQDADNPFYTAMARGAEDRALAHGSAVIVGNSDHNEQRQSRYIDLFEEQRVQGLLIAPVGDITGRIEQLKRRGITAVVVGRPEYGTPYSSVSMDNIAGGYLATKHLLDLGRRRLGFIGGPVALRGVEDRLNGSKKAVDEVAGAALEVFATSDQSVIAGREIGNRIMGRERQERPDALFCTNDLLAIGVMQSLLQERGLSIPGDIALIGYDDIDFAQSAVVPLSSIRQPARLIGETAVDLLLQKLKQPEHEHRHIWFEPNLIARESTVGTGSALAPGHAISPTAAQQ